MRNQRIPISFKTSVKAFALIFGAALGGGCEGQDAFDTTSSVNQTEGAEQLQVQGQPPFHPLGATLETPEVMQAKLLPRMLTASLTSLPTSVDLSGRLPPVGDQGSQGSCTGWAVAYATKTLQEVVEKSWGASTADHQFSPSWIFNQLTSGGGGVSVGSAMGLVVSKGCDTLSDFPYNQNDFATKPTTASMTRAALFPAKSWNTLPVTTTDMKTILAGGNTVVIGFNVLPDFDGMDGSTNTVYNTDAGTRASYSFTTSPCNASTCGSHCTSGSTCGTCGGTGGTTCTVPACTKPPCSRGGHAVALVGYDDNRQAFRFINSWGATWNGNGYGWLAYSFISNGGLGLQPFVMIDAANLVGQQKSAMVWFESSRTVML